MQNKMKYEVGDFGQAHFKLERGITGFCGYVTIIHIDSDYVLFKDNEDFQYHIRMGEFTFEKKEGK